MSPPITFHLPPDAEPAAMQAILQVLAAGPVAPAAVRERVGSQLGKRPRGEALTLARDLGLLAEEGGVLGMTELGRGAAASGELADAVHGLSYFAWSERSPTHCSRLWTYRMITDLLWEAAPVQLDSALKKRLVEEILARAEATFGKVAGFMAARASIGPKTIDGALRWLEQLAPPVVRERTVVRRQRCPPRLMTLALAETMRQTGAEAGADFRLAATERTVLCRACFIEPNALDAMLDWTMQTQPQHVRWGTLNARYGKQVVVMGATPFV